MTKIYRKCFVTIGTTRFDLLCEYILSESVLSALKSIGCEEVILQIGNSDIEPGEFMMEGVKMTLYRFKDSILEDIKGADLVISHAGTGNGLESLEANKPLLIVVNEDLIDNHQLDLAENLQVNGHVYYCNCDTLISTLAMIDFNLLTPFPKADPALFAEYLDDVFKIHSLD